LLPPITINQSLSPTIGGSDWDGVNEYEQERATLVAELGYVALAADIYGADLQTNLTMDQRIELTNMYRNNQTLFVQRIERAMALVKTYSDVDPENIAVIGYWCVRA
jgi:dienelactone hydrolase